MDAGPVADEGAVWLLTAVEELAVLGDRDCEGSAERIGLIC